MGRQFRGGVISAGVGGLFGGVPQGSAGVKKGTHAEPNNTIKQKIFGALRAPKFFWGGPKKWPKF